MPEKRNKSGRTRKFILLLFVLGCAIQLGAALYSSQVTEALWSANPPESLREWGSLVRLAGANFFRIATPIVGLLGLLTLFTSFGTARPHIWWRLVSSATFVGVVVWSVLYFVPTAMLLSGPGLDALSAAEAIQMTETWVMRDAIREALIVVSLVCGICALFLPSRITRVVD